jgi:lipopolysaccharide transport system ATP-binding protein
MIRCESPDLTAPDGSIIAVIEEGSARINAPGIPRLTALPASPGNFLMECVMERMPRVERTLAISRLVRLRGAGATCILSTHDEALMSACADEVWWTRDGQLMARGDPAEVLAKYRAHCAARLRAAGEGLEAAIAPTLRTGDGRACLENIELSGEGGAKSVVFRSGEPMTVAVTIRFGAAIAAPVAGILIRTRIGLNVYGTNTELEGVQLGPVAPGQVIRVQYAFRCDLCPGDYTITAASHDPDGVWHDWLEDAVAFAVSDTRYTAGVANLRASVQAVRVSG